MENLNLETMLRQLYGIDPYNNSSNILYGKECTKDNER